MTLTIEIEERVECYRCCEFFNKAETVQRYVCEDVNTLVKADFCFACSDWVDDREGRV